MAQPLFMPFWFDNEVSLDNITKQDLRDLKNLYKVFIVFSIDVCKSLKDEKCHIQDLNEEQTQFFLFGAKKLKEYFDKLFPVGGLSKEVSTHLNKYIEAAHLHIDLLRNKFEIPHYYYPEILRQEDVKRGVDLTQTHTNSLLRKSEPVDPEVLNEWRKEEGLEGDTSENNTPPKSPKKK